MNIFRHTALTISLVMAAGVLLGCSNSDPAAMLASAKSYIDKNEPKAAIIQLKNVLQKQPDSAEARFLLGKALLRSGDGVAAGVELHKAMALKYPEAQVLPVLAQVMNALGQQDQLISQYGKTDLIEPGAVADFKTSLAAAYAQKGKRESADESLASALKAVPDYLPAQILKVRLMAWQRDFDGAIALIDSVLLRHPSADDAWQLKGDFLLSVKRDPKAALEAYAKALSYKADNLAAHAGILGIRIAQKDLAAAQTQLDALKKALPNHPKTKYFEALLAYEKQDFKTSNEVVSQLLRYSPNDPQVLLLAGLLEIQGKSLLQAEGHLEQALQFAPGHIPTRRLLAQTYLRSGQSAKALSTLQPLLEMSEPDAQSLALAGEAYLRSGDVKQAETYFARAAKLNPNDTRSRTALALTQMEKGNVDAGFGELQLVAAADKGITADMALISAHMRRGEVAAALKATEALERKQPDKPLAAELRGRLYLAQKNVDAARKSFERALQIAPTYFPAAASLAALDLADNKPDQASKRFESLLAVEPKNVQALMAIVQLKAKAGASNEEISKLLLEAIKLNPTEPAPRLMLIEHQMRNKEPKLALAAAQDGVAALPQSGELLSALGQVQLASGDLNQATAAFNKLVVLQSQSPQAYILLADAQLRQKDNQAAAQTLKRALVIKPDFLPAQRGLIQLDMVAGRTSEAKATIRTIQSQRSGEAVGQLFEGDLEASLKNWDGAAKAYKAGLDKNATTELATKYHNMLMAAKKAKEAESFASAWTKAHPKDAVFFFYLGNLALGQSDYLGAETQYQNVKRLLPDNAAALNNIAWLMVKLKKPGALAYAEQANKLQPDQPAFLDTLALVLSEENQHAKAVETQKKAIELQPENGALSLNLAKIYIRSGQKDLAKAELDKLTKLGDKFKGQEQVSQMLKAL